MQDLSLWRAGFSLVVDPEHMGSAVAAHGPSCPAARGNLSSPTRDRTRVLCIGRQILNHWTTREVPYLIF